jgi:ABC-type Zn uptake system ZnuABC Zn-binding protein ZnuA
MTSCTNANRLPSWQTGPTLWQRFFIGVALGLALGGCQRSELATGIRVATSTSYLEAAARDLIEDQVEVVRLAEPGTCPGHFDIRPSQAAELRRCRALLRFDFQNSLDGILAGEGTNHARIVEVIIHGGLCQPDSYLAGCRQVADGLVTGGWLARSNADVRLRAVAVRLEGLARESTNRVAQARLAGVPVIASAHQKEFCEWLGLKVVATFRAADTASVAEIDEAIKRGELAEIKLVIANLPEGRRTADALAERLKAKVVVFGNFPLVKDGRVSFDEMVAGNVNELAKVMER